MDHAKRAFLVVARGRVLVAGGVDVVPRRDKIGGQNDARAVQRRRKAVARPRGGRRLDVQRPVNVAAFAAVGRIPRLDHHTFDHAQHVVETELTAALGTPLDGQNVCRRPVRL